MEAPSEHSFREWLHRELRARRISQRQLALRAGVATSTISRILSGQRSTTIATASRLRLVIGEHDATDQPVPPLLEVPASDPVGRVERALRSDELLTDGDVQRTMQVYLDSRGRQVRKRFRGSGRMGLTVVPRDEAPRRDRR